MKQFIYNPAGSESKMTIVCFVSGSGTNYERIIERNPRHDYIVFSNRPGCEGVLKASQNHHPVIELDHLPFLSPAKEKYSPYPVPRNCPERVAFEQQVARLILEKAGKEPDLICLAGYDQWVTDWMVDKYYPRILNVHPGDTVKGYDGLHWLPSAKAIIAGDEALKSTLFIVDKGEDTGPVLLQSRPLNILKTLSKLEAAGDGGLLDRFAELNSFICRNAIKTYRQFKQVAGEGEKEAIKLISQSLQRELKTFGDWEIYPFGVHDLIARGRVEIDGRDIFIDGIPIPETGYIIRAM